MIVLFKGEKGKEITGMMVYYYFVCKRKLWYFVNEINMEQNSELVSLGKALDETSYQRVKKSILIDNTINIDFMEKGTILHEIKKTKAIEEAGIWQTKYYMYYLEKKGIKNIEAEIDYPLLKEIEKVKLDETDKKVLEKVEKNIREIQNDTKPKEVLNQKLCEKCAYYDLCYI